MTEAEWLACGDPSQIFAAVKGRKHDRKLRLFAVACCRRIAPLGDKEEVQKALAVAELFADGLARKPQRRNAHDSMLFGPSRYPLVSYTLSKVAFEAASRASWSAAWRVAQLAVADFPESAAVTIEELERLRRSVRGKEINAQADLLRDIFGNPFRPVNFDAEWRTTTVVALAQQMYESRDSSVAPILGDALEDSGCIDADILNHCRGPGPHVRGCWVCDLVLGKS
jgi:hypothetical protein